jgi:putative tryptophan/tyrosine transport system substrate-binding protein
MNRRASVAAGSVLVVLVVVSAFLPPVGEGQPAPGFYRIGYLTPFSVKGSMIETFRDGLRAHGYVEGRNVHIEARSSGQDGSRLDALAVEIVATRPDIIVAQTGAAALALKRATTRIPIVMAGSADAVAYGIIASLAQPGGNITGFTLFTPELVPKRLELLRESLPHAKRIAVLGCPVSLTNATDLASAEATARKLGLRLEAYEYRTPASWKAMAEVMQRSRPDGLLMLDCTNIPFEDIADFTLRLRLPSFSPYPATVAFGTFMAYGPDPFGTTRRAAEYVDRILKGARPQDLPVQHPSRYELHINLKTARTLGLTIPASVLARADHVIE